jgi:ABC-type lipoprotein export system ATPase subunit
MAIVDIKNLGKVYHLGAVEVSALRDLDLDIEQGQYVAIMSCRRGCIRP